MKDSLPLCSFYQPSSGHKVLLGAVEAGWSLSPPRAALSKPEVSVAGWWPPHQQLLSPHIVTLMVLFLPQSHITGWQVGGDREAAGALQDRVLDQIERALPLPNSVLRRLRQPAERPGCLPGGWHPQVQGLPHQQARHLVRTGLLSELDFILQNSSGCSQSTILLLWPLWSCFSPIPRPLNELHH